MTRLLFVLALTASAAAAQTTTGDPDPRESHTITVFASGDALAFRIAGQSRDDYVWLVAGGTLHVRSGDGVRAIVLIGDDSQGTAGTDGKASVEVGPRDPAEKLRARARREGPARALRSTFHPVTVLACEKETAAGDCVEWAVVPPASGDAEAGFTLRVLDDLFTEPVLRYREDPPLDPDPR